MKKSIPPSFAAVENDIGDIKQLIAKAESQTLRVAQILARDVLELLPEGLARELFKLPAVGYFEETQNPGFNPKQTAVDLILLKAIKDSWTDCNFTNCFLTISKTDLQNIGLSVVPENKDKTIEILESLCNAMTRGTKQFITCGFMSWGSDKYPDYVQLWANCDFLNKTIPAPEMVS